MGWDIRKEGNRNNASLMIKQRIGAKELRVELDALDKTQGITDLTLAIQNLSSHAKQVFQWLDEADFAVLATLELLDSSFRPAVPDSQGAVRLAVKWEQIMRSMPKLKNLRIQAHLRLSSLQLLQLEELRLEGDVWPGLYEKETFLLPALKKLTLKAEADEHGVAMGWAAIARLLDGKRFPKLNELDISNLALDVEGEPVAKLLANTPGVAKLKKLAIRLGDIEELEAFAENAKSFSMLAELRIYGARGDSSLSRKLKGVVVFPDEAGMGDAVGQLIALQRKTPPTGERFDAALESLSRALAGSTFKDSDRGWHLFEKLLKNGRITDAVALHRTLFKASDGLTRLQMDPLGKLSFEGHWKEAFEVAIIYGEPQSPAEAEERMCYGLRNMLSNKELSPDSAVSYYLLWAEKHPKAAKAYDPKWLIDAVQKAERNDLIEKVHSAFRTE